MVHVWLLFSAVLYCCFIGGCFGPDLGVLRWLWKLFLPRRLCYYCSQWCWAARGSDDGLVVVGALPFAAVRHKFKWGLLAWCFSSLTVASGCLVIVGVGWR
jgi:hypothetical protein